ncbi:DNA repair exonuclease [Pueribacillus theae]|uniref:DNA repair exonuclease n=1 Tax=Pueribacillus theae TaxID=2171751 RepID=A0A2U1JTG9_9BACI|nr:DNA repair exonuclease [Pueribacillus theae]PWA08510.1 DNA repair exonuclease [Pueribacillus theae]
MEITFIHAADLHLGRVYSGLRHLPEKIYKQLEESAYRSLERIISAAIENNVDFVLFVGDLFDSNTVSLRAQIRFRGQLERLEEHGIQAFISFGNHDPLSTDNRSIVWPSCVNVFDREEVMSIPFIKNGQQRARIYGFSYETPKVLVDKSTEYIRKDEAGFHIGMLHGNAEGQSEHDPYAPFSVSALLEKDFDYWALGHIHKRMIVSKEPPVVYPGNIQGMHIKETGEKGCFLVKLSKGTVPKTTFISTADIVWQERELSITNLSTVDELLEKLASLKQELRENKLDTFVKIRLTGYGVLNEILQSAEKLDDILWHIREEEEERKPFVWPVGIDVETTGDWNRDELKDRTDFIGEAVMTLETYDGYEEALKPLFSHRMARRYLIEFNEEEKIKLLNKAERLLLTELFRGASNDH